MEGLNYQQQRKRTATREPRWKYCCVTFTYSIQAVQRQQMRTSQEWSEFIWGSRKRWRAQFFPLSFSFISRAPRLCLNIHKTWLVWWCKHTMCYTCIQPESFLFHPSFILMTEEVIKGKHTHGTTSSWCSGTPTGRIQFENTNLFLFAPLRPSGEAPWHSPTPTIKPTESPITHTEQHTNRSC